MKVLGKNPWKKEYFDLFPVSIVFLPLFSLAFSCLFCFNLFLLSLLQLLYLSCFLCASSSLFSVIFCLPSEKLSSVDRELLGQLGMITALTADQYWYLFWNDDCCALWSRRISDPISDYQSQDGCSVHNRYQQLIVQSLKWRSARSSSNFSTLPPKKWLNIQLKETKTIQFP